MLSRSWRVLGMLMLPTWLTAQTVKKADLVGGWVAELKHRDGLGQALGTRGWIVLWPDGLWWYGGAPMAHEPGGARWRLVGDTLWLANDYLPYFHGMIDTRIVEIQAKGEGLAAMDTAVIQQRPPFSVPDSLYWSPAFRDSTTACANDVAPWPCGTWVYHVARQGQRLSLVRLDRLSRATQSVAITAILTRDSLKHCHWGSGCE